MQQQCKHRWGCVKGCDGNTYILCSQHKCDGGYIMSEDCPNNDTCPKFENIDESEEDND